MFILLAVAVLLLPSAQPLDAEWLLSNLGTKTPYDQRKWDADGDSELQGPAGVDPEKLTDPPKKCLSTPSHIEVLARHGARHTGKPSSMDDLATALTTLGSPLPWLDDYKYSGGAVDANMLLPLGVSEHASLGSRVKDRMGVGFFEEYNPNLLRFNSTSIARAGQSATSFLQGAGVQSPFVVMVPVDEDRGMRFYDSCDAWDLQTNAAVDEVVNTYVATEEFQSALKQFNSLLKLPSGIKASLSQFTSSFEACAYDLILSDDDSKFCSLMSEEIVQVNQYITDLKKFYQYGPAFEISRNFTAHLFKDLVESIEMGVEGGFKGTLRFAHAETVIPFLSAIGVFDADMLGEGGGLSPEKRDEERVFKSSKFFPFAANVVIEVYECYGDKRLKFLVNENEISSVRGCGGEVYCRFGDFKASVKDLLELADEFSLLEICKVI